MFNQLQWTTFLVGALLAAIAPMVQAQTMALEPREAAIADAANQSLESSEGVAIAQQTETAIPITNVQIGATATGLSIELEIPDDRELQSFTSGFGETVIIDLINTRLDLETGDAILQDNPAAGIASVQVAPLDDNSVRITVIGQEQAPTVEVSQADGKLIVGVATGAAIADQPPDAPILPESQAPTDEDAIRIVVTEDPVESPYLVPETTTGTRTDTSIFEIPQTIQVLPEQLLEDQQVITLEDAILNVPNAVRGNDGGGVFDDFAIRGFENAQILRDGFRDAGVAGARQGIEELANVEQIEVLSGPASILLGSLEPGGIINLVTKRPLPEFFAEVEVRAGSFNSVRPSLDISGPLTTEGDVLYRLNAAYQFSDEFPGIDTNLERFFVAPVLEWRIGDRTTLLLDLEYVDDTRPFDRGIPAIGDEVADIPLDTFLGEPEDVIEIDSLEAGYRFEHEFRDGLKVRNRFRYSNTDFFTRRAEILLGPGIPVNEETGDFTRNFISNDSEIEAFEVQTELIGEFTTGSFEHTLLFGIDFFRSDIDAFSSASIPAIFAPLVPPGFPLTPPINIFDPQIGLVDTPETPFPITSQDIEADLSQVGLILQDQIQLLPNLNLLLGGRLDIISQDTQSAAIFFPPFVNTPASSSEDSFTNFSPRVGIVYQPIEPLYLYASYSQSFTPNILTATTVEGEFLDPEEAEQFEIGAKANLLDGRLAVTLALFDLTLENIAAADPNFPEFVVPIGKQTSRGVELVVQGEILPGWNVVASYGFLDSEVEESGGVFPEDAVPRNVASNTASLFTTYEIQQGALEGLGFGVGVFFVGDRPGDFENTFDLGSYVRTDASLFYRRGRWRLGLDFENIFDVDYFVGSSAREDALPGEPFNVLGSIAVTF